MPTLKALSRAERVYTALETTFGTAVAVTGSNVQRNVKFGVGNDVNLLKRRDKTGSRTAVIGTRGRVSSKWSYEASLVGSGAAGTAPPHDVIYQLLFGAAGTAVASTS